MNISNNKKYANEILDDIECYKLVLQGKIKTFPKGFWTKPWSLQSARLITRYLLEERLHYNREDTCKKVSKQTFLDNKLYGMISKVFSGSVPMAIQNAYPNEFQPWELSSCPKGFWKDEENIKQAVRWVVETLLNNNRERVCKEFTGKLLKENGLGTIKKDYGVYGLLNMTYPNEFKPWEVVECGNNFWDEEKNVKEAVRWLVKTKLDNNRQRVCKEFTARFLSKNGFSSLLAYGIYNLLNMAYPNEFKPEELEKAHMIKNYNWRQERRKRVK